MSSSYKAQYIVPRIGIIDIRKFNDVELMVKNLKQYHGKYFQLFNLTNTTLFGPNNPLRQHETKFKWRGTPFSITQAIKVLNKMDTYLRTNKGNSVIICVNTSDSYLYSKIIIRQYFKICNWCVQWDKKNQGLSNKLRKLWNSISNQQPYFSEALSLVYQKKLISSPPVKAISAFYLSTTNFIPIIEIYQEARYNDFQLIYTHDVTNEIAEYYFNLNKPLQVSKKSTGSKYYDRRPETKYLAKPIQVCGDVKIVCYSYNTIQRKRQFSFGFNTKQLIFSEQLGQNQGIMTFTYKDLHDRRIEQVNQKNKLLPDKNIQTNLYDEKIQIYVKIQNECINSQQCIHQSKCEDCQQYCKKLNLRYNQTQGDINDLDRSFIEKGLRNRLKSTSLSIEMIFQSLNDEILLLKTNNQRNEIYQQTNFNIFLTYYFFMDHIFCQIIIQIRFQ